MPLRSRFSQFPNSVGVLRQPTITITITIITIKARFLLVSLFLFPPNLPAISRPCVNCWLVRTIYRANSACHVAKFDFDRTVHVNWILIGQPTLSFDGKRPQTSPNVPNHVPRVDLGTRAPQGPLITFCHVAHVTHVSRLLVYTMYGASIVCHVAKLDFDLTVHVVRNFDRTVHICWFRFRFYQSDFDTCRLGFRVLRLRVLGFRVYGFMG
jgi:hypothetical protein